MTDTHPENASPRIERVRHELKRRKLTVEGVERLTRNMLRIELSGEDLADFPSIAFDDHLKIFAPDGAGGEAMRDYTPRRFDTKLRRLTIDFAIHESGPATLWALGARQGDAIEIGGPRGSRVITGDIKRWLLIGDETALPAIGRHLEEAEEGVAITTLVAVEGEEDHMELQTAATHRAVWAHRSPSAAADASALIEALETIETTPDTFVWIAAEGMVARRLRAHMLEQRGHPLQWLKASGYWVAGEEDATVSFE